MANITSINVPGRCSCPALMVPVFNVMGFSLRLQRLHLSRIEHIVERRWRYLLFCGFVAFWGDECIYKRKIACLVIQIKRLSSVSKPGNLFRGVWVSNGEYVDSLTRMSGEKIHFESDNKKTDRNLHLQMIRLCRCHCHGDCIFVARDNLIFFSSN